MESVKHIGQIQAELDKLEAKYAGIEIPELSEEEALLVEQYEKLHTSFENAGNKHKAKISKQLDELERNFTQKLRDWISLAEGKEENGDEYWRHYGRILRITGIPLKRILTVWLILMRNWSSSRSRMGK
jgi:hypothetical protein